MVLAAAFVAQAETKFNAVSPDGLNEVRLEVGDKGMSYSVWRRGKVLVKPSSVALNLNSSVEEFAKPIYRGLHGSNHMV